SQITANDTGGTTLAGNIVESGGGRILTAAGTGTLSLTNPANNHSGGTTLNAGAATGLGTLVPVAPGALGTGVLTLTAGVLQANTALTITNAIALNSNNAPVAFSGSAITFTGAVTQTNAPLLLATNTTTFAGILSGNVPLTLSSTPVPAGNATLRNTGTIAFTAADSSTSTVTINGGTLVLGGAGGALSAITGITVNTG